ncbi:hypothetical protein BZA77DRAFT_339504 [Pyronema omphalodes]|nr:hypothetical protein BZA77DRAFT_339504 [Pyronema omphalodes]
MTIEQDNLIMAVSAIAPRHYDAGYVALSYFVSLIGSLSTLQLLQLRTSGRGLYNWYLLFGSSVTMGGIAIWSMHFIGNRATVLYNGEPELQLAYNSTFTVVSFFVPVLVLLGAYSLAGVGGDEVRKLRVIVGGTFAGSSICGMHYLGDAGISNYNMKYSITRVVASVIIAISATNIALALFFIMHKNFTNLWWKRLILAFILAGAVSGMHWTASSGTTYMIKRKQAISDNTLSRQWVVVIVIVLSVFCCTILLAFAAAAGRERRQQYRRAQKIVLASVIFEDGKLMVLSDGTLPTKTITDTFSERSFEESFGKRHHVFHWIYRTSRNWRAVVDLVPGMRRHLRSTMPFPRHYHVHRGETTQFEEYSILFQEMFCVAAKELADAIHQPMESVGVLYEDIIITASASTKSDPEIQYEPRPGRGKVLFLVKRVDKAEATRLGTFGFRFTSPVNVYDVLSRTMMVSKHAISTAITNMANYNPEREALSPPGVYLGCFAVQADINGGFDVLVQQGATSKLPNRPLGIPTLTSAHLRFMQQYNGKTTTEIIAALKESSTEAAQTAGLTEEFAAQFQTALLTLRNELRDTTQNDTKDTYFDQAILDSQPHFLPTVSLGETSSPNSLETTAQIIVFKTIIPIHTAVSSRQLTLTPFNFFSTQQRAYPGCPEHEVHARRVHREFSGRIAPLTPKRAVTRRERYAQYWRPKIGLRHGGFGDIDTISRNLASISQTNLAANDPFASAGIMVCKEVTVDVAEPKNATEMKDLGPKVDIAKIDETVDGLTLCEVLLKSLFQDMKK